MRAWLFDGQQLTYRSDDPVPIVPEGESLVRVRRMGICDTDIEIMKGYMGFRGVIGHEFVGVVEQGDLLGTRVVGEINAACGCCPTCRRGDETHCPQRTTLGINGRHGALADFLVLPSSNLHPIPDDVQDWQAVFVEPLAAACEITERTHIRPTDRVCVVGDGKLGLLVAQVLSLTGCLIVTIGRHPEKLQILARRGITTTTDPGTQKEAFDVVVDCTGEASGFNLARRLTRPRGTLVLKSTFHGSQETSFAPIVIDEITLVGSRCGPFEPALRLLEKRLVDVDSMMTAEYPLEQANDALKHASTKGAIKVQVVMS